MEILNKYFESLVFQYIEEKQNYAIYAALIKNMLAGNMGQYIIAFVPTHLGVQKTAKLKDLSWTNLQSRLCPKDIYKNTPSDLETIDKC